MTTARPQKDRFMSCPCGRGDYHLCRKCPYDWCSVHGGGGVFVELGPDPQENRERVNAAVDSLVAQGGGTMRIGPGVIARPGHPGTTTESEDA